MKTINFLPVILLAPLAIAVGCSTAPKVAVNGEQYQPDVVLSRIDDLNKRPSWLDETRPFRVENGYVVSLGQTTIPAGDSIEAAYRIAENNAKGAISSAIQDRLKFIFQNAEQGTSLDATQTKYIGEEVSKLTTSELRLDRHYWEKVATTSDDGQRMIEYRVFATVRMPETNFKTAVLDAIRKREGMGGISKDFAEKVNHEWNTFVNGDQNTNMNSDQATAQNRTTASSN